MVTNPPAVASVLERFGVTVRTHELFLPGQTVVAAVSGGPDSVCLLESLVRLRRSLRVRPIVAHVDHGLRQDSVADAAYVRRQAERHDVPFHLRTLELVELSREGSREEWLRLHRRRALVDVAREVGADRIATAHTRDDNAETVLLRLLTGSGTAGVAGIRHRAGPFVRPLLDVGRGEVESFCRALHLRPRRDPTNEDPTYALRNALRHEGIPALELALGRNVREPLARAAALLTADDAELMRQAWEVWSAAAVETDDGIALDADALLGVPGVIAARIVSQGLFRTGADTSRSDVDAVLDLARGRPGRRRHLSGGVRALRERTAVRLTRR